jgi:hypothetical protein
MMRTIFLLVLAAALAVSAEKDASGHIIRYTGLQAYREYPPFRLNLKYGFDYRIVTVSEDLPLELNRYLQGMRLGRSFSADISFYPFKYAGIGLDFASFSSADEKEPVVLADLETGVVAGYGKIADEVTITTFGPALFFRRVVGGGNQMITVTIGGAYFWYTDENTMKDENTAQGRAREVSGACWGPNFQLHYDYRIWRFLGFGLGFGYLDGTVRDLLLEGDKGSLSGIEGMGRFRLMVGVRGYY